MGRRGWVSPCKGLDFEDGYSSRKDICEALPNVRGKAQVLSGQALVSWRKIQRVTTVNDKTRLTLHHSPDDFCIKSAFLHAAYAPVSCRQSCPLFHNDSKCQLAQPLAATLAQCMSSAQYLCLPCPQLQPHVTNSKTIDLGISPFSFVTPHDKSE